MALWQEITLQNGTMNPGDEARNFLEAGNEMARATNVDLK
jgi:hypothetical protein